LFLDIEREVRLTPFVVSRIEKSLLGILKEQPANISALEE